MIREKAKLGNEVEGEGLYVCVCVCVCVWEITKEMTVVNIRMNYEGKFGFVYEI